jgi:hypothetical protein
MRAEVDSVPVMDVAFCDNFAPVVSVAVIVAVAASDVDFVEAVAAAC